MLPMYLGDIEYIERIERWYTESPILLDRQLILKNMCVYNTHELIHTTTEDEDAPDRLGEWLADLIEQSTVPYRTGSAFDLRCGMINTRSILVGNGKFDSSFPILIYRRADYDQINMAYNVWSRRPPKYTATSGVLSNALRENRAR